MSTPLAQRIRIGSKALELAQRVCEASDYKNPESLATLAAAYAECGEYAEAIRVVKQALEVDASSKHADRLNRMLMKFRSGEPFRRRSSMEASTNVGPGPIEPDGDLVTANTVLNAGDNVQVQWSGTVVLSDGESTNESWWNGEVLDCNSDGTVRIHYAGWNPEWDESVSRDRLRIKR